MSRRKKEEQKKGEKKFDSKYFTKRWLRAVVMRSVRFWAPVLRLDALVDCITIFITERDDKEIGKNGGACVTIDHTRRSADVRIKRNVVALMANEYPGIKMPEEVVEMTVLHEFNHIIVNPIADWATNTIETLSNKKILGSLFEHEEERTVEHLTRVFFHLHRHKRRDSKKKFKGRIVYMTKDPTEDE